MENLVMRRRVNFLVTVIFILVLVFYFSGKSNNTYTNSFDCLTKLSENTNLPIIYAVTPTYARPVQKAELTRLSHTIMLVPNIHWIIIEDANETSKLVENILKRAKIYERSTHLNIKTPDNFKLKGKDPNWSKPRGVEQRNLALSWIRNHFKNLNDYKHSFLFFMDDDNTYSLELFEEIIKIEPSKVGVWPVGLVGGLRVEKPILDENNIVTGFNAVWRPERPFPVDMAGFAISINLLLEHPDAIFSYEIPRGFQESEILRHLTVLNELQPLANNCKNILVWHTRTETPKLETENKLIAKGQQPSDYHMEV